MLELFFSFFRTGILAVGGAYSFLPLIEKEVVEKYGWLTKNEFLDVLGITQIFPGAISIKYATYVGYKVAGIPGVLLANLGNFLPPAIMVFAAAYFYSTYKEIPAVEGAFKMVRLAVFSMVVAVSFQLIGLKTLASAKTIMLVSLFIIAFITGKIHPAFIIIGAGLIGSFIR